MERPVSIAIETSCRRGGVALGAGGRLVETVDFQADRRHAVQLVARLNELLGRHGLRAKDVQEVFVSVGPGSFTGLRIGLAVAVTLMRAVESLRCVAVPSALAVARNAPGNEAGNEADLRHVGVILDAGADEIYSAIFVVRDDTFVPLGRPGLLTVEKFLAEAPRPILLLGEGLGYHEIAGQGVTVADEKLWMPTAEGLWRAGNQLAGQGRFAQPGDLSPIYLRKPQAVRAREKR